MGTTGMSHRTWCVAGVVVDRATAWCALNPSAIGTGCDHGSIARVLLLLMVLLMRLVVLLA